MYLLSAGKVYLGSRDNSGNPLGLTWVGDVSMFSLLVRGEPLRVLRTAAGTQLTAPQANPSLGVSARMVWDDVQLSNLLAALLGTSNTQSSASVSNEALPNPVTVGARYLLANRSVSSVVVRDSTGSPKTLPAGQYSVNAAAGSIVINDATTGGAYAQPFKVSYTAAQLNWAALGNAAPPERWMRYEGINIGNGGSAVVLDLYRVVLPPADQLQLIGTDLAQLSMEASVLPDEAKAGGALGRFGRLYV